MKKNNKFMSLLLIRATDIVLSVSLFLLLLPILIVIPIVMFVSTGTPIIFAQTRVGKNKKEFIIYKFRSMHHAHSSYIGGREAMVKGSSAKNTNKDRESRTWILNYPTVIGILSIFFGHFRENPKKLGF